MSTDSTHVFMTEDHTSQNGEQEMGATAQVVGPDAGDLADAGRSELVSLTLPDRAGLLLRRPAVPTARPRPAAEERPAASERPAAREQPPARERPPAKERPAARERPAAGKPGRLEDVRSRAVVGSGHTDLHFVELHRGELVRVALSVARLPHVLSVVVCPAGVSPGRTALALAVAGMLRLRRASGTPVVTCAVCPPLGDGRTAIPHEVRVSANGQVQVRLVWEIVTWDDLPSTALVG